MGNYGGVIFYGALIKNGEHWDECDLTDEQEEFYNQLDNLKENGICCFRPYNGTFDSDYRFIFIEKSMHDSDNDNVFVMTSMNKYNKEIKEFAIKHDLIIGKPSWIFARHEL
jgi:hypothetical protein